MNLPPFIPSESILSEVAKSAAFEEHDSEVTLHFCEKERSLSLLNEFEPLPSSPEKVVLDHDRDSTMISHDDHLRWRIYGLWNFVRRRLWSPMKRIPQMSMGPSSLKCHTHSMQLQSQTCLVYHAHTRTTTTSWSSFVKLSGGWL